MSQNASVLLVTWDGAGNLPPERSLARALIARGHTVRVLAHKSVRETFERDGAEFLPVQGAPHYDSKVPMAPKDEMPFVSEHVWFAKDFGTELLAAVDRFQPNLLLVDICLTYALVAAHGSGLPAAALCHFPYQLAIGPFASLFDSRLHETNAYAAEFGIPPFQSYQALVEALPLLLVNSYRPFDLVEALASTVTHVGPCRSPQGEPKIWRGRTSGLPLVLVGLSTSHQNQAALLQRLCDALGNLKVEALVTTGPAIPTDLLKPSANTTVLTFVPHDEVLPSADLLITHAGHGTVMAGLTYGVPMLCFPMGRDQPMIAARVAQLGLGSVVSCDAPTSEIERAIAEILAAAAPKRRAKDFADSLTGHPGLVHAVELIEKLLSNPRPAQQEDELC